MPRQLFTLSGFSLLAALVATQSPERAAADDVASPYIREAYFAALEGNNSQRQQLLAAAQASAPDNPAVRWQSGQIEYRGEWLPVTEAQAAAAADPKQEGYQKLREQVGTSLPAQLEMAHWCRRAGLADEARYHWQQVLASNPRHADALRAMRLRYVNGQYVAFDALSNRNKRLREQEEVTRGWKNRLLGWKRAVASRESSVRDNALEEISDISDRLAIAVLEPWTLPEWGSEREVRGQEDVALSLVIALSNMTDEEATDSLVRHALASSYPVVREAAATALGERSWYEFVPDLLDELANPVESNWKISRDSIGDVHYQHTLFQPGAFADRAIESQNTLQQIDGRVGGTGTGLDPIDLAIRSRAARQSSLYNRRALAVETYVAELNGTITNRNDRIVTLLNTATAQSLTDDADQWWTWWTDYTSTTLPDDKYVDRKVYSESEREFYRSPTMPTAGGCECFVAGTLVWTKTGLEPIETLGEGDLVLSQDTESGELAFRPIVRRTIRKPSPAMNVRCGSDMITATIGHPFWRLGEGWRMVKQLSAGDVVAGATEPLWIESLEPAGDIEAHNLIVEDFGTYFVGNAGLLVHDGTPTPSAREVAPGIKVSQAKR